MLCFRRINPYSCTLQPILMWLLFVEDEVHLATSITRGLEEEGYAVDWARDGAEGLTLGNTHAYDAIIVDWRLPKRSGKQLITDWRAHGQQAPILMLTALGDVRHRVEGLDAGADDYMTKPFAFEELLARLRALLRRSEGRTTTTVLQAGPITLDTARRMASVGAQRLWLRPKEYAVLEVLMRQPDHVFSRTRLVEQVWGDTLFVSDNVVDVTMSGLRQKLAQHMPIEDSTSVQIVTLRGVGYRLEVRDCLVK